MFLLLLLLGAIIVFSPVVLHSLFTLYNLKVLIPEVLHYFALVLIYFICFEIIVKVLSFKGHFANVSSKFELMLLKFKGIHFTIKNV